MMGIHIFAPLTHEDSARNQNVRLYTWPQDGKERGQGGPYTNSLAAGDGPFL